MGSGQTGPGGKTHVRKISLGPNTILTFTFYTYNI